MASLKNILESHQGDGLPNILAIGTANPPNCFYQADYPNFYFQVTKNDHMLELKNKFKRICEKSSIKKRYMYLNDEIINDNPNLMVHKAPSLDARLDIVATQIPKLGKEAALKAIAEWRQPISNITHLIFCSSTDLVMPGLDIQLAKLMGLKPCVQKFMIYQQGCSAAGTAFRLAKDLARNNASARVLIVCCELIVVCFHPPSETRLDQLVGSALFADGAAAVIVGSNPNTTEHPLFQIVSANQTIIPDSENMLGGQLREMGVNYYMSKDLPKCVANNIQQCYAEAVSPFGITDSNKLFYIVHPGGPAILQAVEQKLGLTKDKLKATWQVLSEYGNMRSPSVLFILDEMRKTSMLEGKATTGEGLEWGILFAFGPGVTVETVVLRSCAAVN